MYFPLLLCVVKGANEQRQANVSSAREKLVLEYGGCVTAVSDRGRRATERQSRKMTSKISPHFGHFTVAAYGGFGGTSRCSRVTDRGPTLALQNGQAVL